MWSHAHIVFLVFLNAHKVIMEHTYTQVWHPVRRHRLKNQNPNFNSILGEIFPTSISCFDSCCGHLIASSH